MARRLRMCVVEGCERRSSLGQLVCTDHEGTELGVTMSRQVAKLEREVHALAVAKTEGERMEAARRFQQRVERGDFAALMTGRFRELVQQPAGDGLTTAAGALQLAIVRLLVEEPDPTKMATALSRVANATARVAKTQEGLSRKLEEEERTIAEARQTLQRRRVSMEQAYQGKLEAIRNADEMAREAVAKIKRAEAWEREAQARAEDAERRWEAASKALAANEGAQDDRPEERGSNGVKPGSDPELAAFDAKYEAYRASRPGLTAAEIRDGQAAGRGE